MSRQLMDTVNRLPVGVVVDLGDRAAILVAVTPDPTPGRPARLRLDLDGEEPDWRDAGEIVHYSPAPTAADVDRWWADFQAAA